MPEWISYAIDGSGPTLVVAWVVVEIIRARGKTRTADADKVAALQASVIEAATAEWETRRQMQAALVAAEQEARDLRDQAAESERKVQDLRRELREARARESDHG